ncbi:MAG: hypothetical protein E3J56_01160 [Candidatus Aminicenantes bacterium]|nr:MAG: hypothetical protein E3J56_01160 [Candidatus Aminicenantes bacterium]
MSREPVLSLVQRVKNLKGLVNDAHKLGFNFKLVSRFENELNELQAIIERDKSKRKKKLAELKKLDG